MTPIKKVWIFGVGGVGGYFGVKIAHTIGKIGKNGHEVYFVARGDHLKAIKSDGLTLVTAEQTITAAPTAATDDVDNIPHPDLVLLCVKSYDLQNALCTIQPKVKRDTLILPLQNGVDIHERVRSTLKTGIVLPACVYVGTCIDQPGVIRSNGGDGKILWGKDPELSEFKPQRVIDYFETVGINHKYADDPFPAIWEKYIFIAAFALTTVYFNLPLGEVLTRSKPKKVLQSIMEEILQLAKQKKIVVKKTLIEDSIAKADQFPVQTKTSYQRDIEVKGELNEGDLFGETIIRQGRQLGIFTPVTEYVHTQIQRRLKEIRDGKNHC